jgi:undecaprenyl-diphosphatase
VNRVKAVQFSFLLGIPAFLGAAGWKLATFEPVAGSTLDFPSIAVGTITAFALTFVAIPLTIKIVRRKWLGWFALYCFLLGAAVIAYEIFKSQ